MSGMNPIEPPGLIELLFGCVRGSKNHKNNSSKATTVAQSTMPTNQHQPPARPLPNTPAQGGQYNPQIVGTVASQSLPTPRTLPPSPYYPATAVAMQPLGMRLVGAASDIQDKFETFYNNPSPANLKSFNNAILDYPADNEPFPRQYMAVILPSFTELLTQHGLPEGTKLYDALDTFSNLIMMYNNSIAPFPMGKTPKDMVTIGKTEPYVNNVAVLVSCVEQVLDHFSNLANFKDFEDLKNVNGYMKSEQITILGEMSIIRLLQYQCQIYCKNHWRVTPELENSEFGMGNIATFDKFLEAAKKVDYKKAYLNTFLNRITCLRAAANAVNYEEHNGNASIIRSIMNQEFQQFPQIYIYGIRIKSLKFMIEAALRSESTHKAQIIASILVEFRDATSNAYTRACYAFTKNDYVHDLITTGIAAIKVCHPSMQGSFAPGTCINKDFNLGMVSSFLQDIVDEKTRI